MTFGLGANLLDACMLAVLSRGDAYGYLLTQNVRDVVDISDSTLYPVLRRLQKDGCLTTYDQPFQGRNRRYYAITPQGKALYTQYIADWNEYKAKLDRVILGAASGGGQVASGDGQAEENALHTQGDEPRSREAQAASGQVGENALHTQGDEPTASGDGQTEESAE